MGGRVYWPIVVSRFLLAGSEVSVSLGVHLRVFLAVVHVLGIEDFLRVLAAQSGHTELELLSGNLGHLLRPVVTSLIPSTQGLLHLRSILSLLDVVKFVRKALQVLSLDNFVDVF